jgi:hypothetical protein
LSNSTASTVSTSYKLGLDDDRVVLDNIQEEVIPRFEELGIDNDNNVGPVVESRHNSKNDRVQTGAEEWDRTVAEWVTSGGGRDGWDAEADIARGAEDRGEEQKRKKKRKRRKRKGVERRPTSGGDSEEIPSSRGKGRDDIGAATDRKDELDSEIMMAIWNGIERIDQAGIQMCMDDAGRWRIAWGQLAD